MSPIALDGEPALLSRAGGFIGQHILVPKEGVVIHINATTSLSGVCWKK
jgi:oxepin-CoA hydrolase/3-oxo-5,6-dehydrosuberyl-CoA semialdehyde dehydrogenase